MRAHTPDTVLESVGGAIGADRVRAADPSRDAVDELLPAVVARPANAAEVAELLGVATREGLAVIPTAGGTRRALGNPPERADVLLDLSALGELREWARRDGVLIAEAGLAVARAERVVAAEAHTLARDWPTRAASTLGGSAAVGRPPLDALGPAGPRWSVIGLEVAAPDGTLRRHGARVAKNVAGLDLVRLHVGALGTLGVITELTLRVRPRATHGVAPPPAAGAAFHARVLAHDGTELALVEVRVPAGRTLADAPPRTLSLAAPPGHEGAREGFQRWLAAWRDVTARAGGVAIVMSAPASWKRGIDVWGGAAPSALALMRELKHLYDPARVVNPARYVAGI